MLFVKVIIDYIFHYHGHSRAHLQQFVCLRLRFTDCECNVSSAIFRLCYVMIVFIIYAIVFFRMNCADEWTVVRGY
jgi:hypothetical protein